MRHLFSYIITRLLLAIPMVFIMMTIIFVVLRIMPGDPVGAMLGGHAPQKVIDEKKEELGLNKPIAVQYVEYLGQLLRLDLGESMIFKQKVSQPIIEKLPATIELTLVSAARQPRHRDTPGRVCRAAQADRAGLLGARCTRTSSTASPCSGWALCFSSCSACGWAGSR